MRARPKQRPHSAAPGGASLFGEMKMAQSMFRIYRVRASDPFESPAGWLSQAGPRPKWVPSYQLRPSDVFTKSEVDLLTEGLKVVWQIKGLEFEVRSEKA